MECSYAEHRSYSVLQKAVFAECHNAKSPFAESRCAIRLEPLGTGFNLALHICWKWVDGTETLR